MDSWEITMTIPLVGYSPNELLEFMLEMCRITPGTSTKPVNCHISSMGKGKTRAIMSIFEASVAKEGVLCLPVTMNHLWSDSSYDDWVIPTDNTRTSEQLQATLAIISRLACVFYNISHQNSHNILYPNIYNYIKKNVSDSELIRLFLSHAIIKLNESSNNSKITNLIILFDEGKKFVERYPTSEKSEDSLSVLRNAILNDYITENKEVNAALLISSQDPSPIGAIFSNRDDVPLNITESYDPDEILTSIFLPIIKSFQLKISKSDEFKLKLFLSSINQLPRLIEMITLFIKEYCNNLKLNQINDFVVNEAFAIEWQHTLPESIQQRYLSKISNLPPKIFSSMIYRDEIEYTDYVSGLVLGGTLTNLITEFKRTTKEKITIVPAYAPAMYLCIHENDWSLLSLKKLNELIYNITLAMFDQDNAYKEGYWLEKMFESMLLIRCESEIKSFRNRIKLTNSRLLGIKDESVIEDTKLHKFLSNKIDLGSILFIKQLTNSYKNPIEFIKEFCEMQSELSVELPFILFKCCSSEDVATDDSDEAYNIGWTWYRGKQMNPGIVFTNQKSKRFQEKYKNKSLPSQYLLQLMIENGFVAENLAYIYYTISDSNENMYEKSNEIKQLAQPINSRVFVLTTEHMQNFMNAYWYVYNAIGSF